jgi:hypothetical protein
MDLDLAGRMRKLLEAVPYNCNIASLTPEVFLKELVFCHYGIGKFVGVIGGNGKMPG